MVQSVYERLTIRIETHRECHDLEPLSVTVREIGEILRECGVEDDQIIAFRAGCGQRFGPGTALSPANLIDSRRFEVRCAEIVVTTPPERSCMVETRVIDGRRYLLISVEEDLRVNGMSVDWTDTEQQSR